MIYRCDWSPERLQSAEDRERKIRWSYTDKSSVSHSEHGSVIVPHGSNLSALRCAADVWGVDWLSILDARVEKCDQSLPVCDPGEIRQKERNET